MIDSLLLKLPRQHALDAMNFGGYVSRRQPGDVSDRGGVESLQVGENHVSINRFETLNEIQQAFQLMAAVRGLEGVI
jgi:hypothetical protein